MFTIIPAIDIKNGRCVRLRQGRVEEMTVYSDDPVAMALRWQAEGAAFLHVVDLDGAFEKRPVHTDLVAAICRAITIPVELGGGIRTAAHIRDLLDRGLNRVILGTRACADPGSVRQLTAEFGDAIVIGIDARDGKVQVNGWVDTTEMTALDLARRMEQAGVRTLIYTDTATDGMLGGPNTEAVRALCEAVPGCRVIASGGVSEPAHAQSLASLGLENLEGAIVGKALYDGRTTLAELQAAAR
jgi:phosphoribosylformimino-5-aminoimidazole carboxamide ribotide isomerase